MSVTASELYGRGVQLGNERRYPAAQRALTKAAALAEADPNLSARIAGTLAYVLSQMGDNAAGEQLCRDALALEGLTGHTRGVVAGQLGSLLTNQGRLDEALPWLGRAIESIQDDPIAVANLRMNRSVLNMQRVNLAESAADLEAAVAVYGEHGDQVGRAEAQHNLGYVALLGGDLVEALQQMTAARPTISELSAANGAIGDVDRAEALRDAGQVREAERLLIAAAVVFAKNRMPQARAEAEFHTARSLLRHDAAAAARTARAATRHFAAIDSQLWRARAEAIALRAVLASGGLDVDGRRIPAVRGKASAEDVTRVAAELNRQGLRNEALALRLAHHQWAARRGLSTGRLPRLHSSANLEVRLLAHEVRTARASHADRPVDTLRHAARGLDELEGWRSSFGSLDLQTSLSMHGNALMMSGLNAAVRTRRPEVIFDWSERARALNQQIAPLRPPPDPELATRLAELRVLRADLATSDWLANPRAARLAEEVRHHQWAAAGKAGQVERQSLSVVRRGLDDDTALLSFVFSPSGLVCLVVTSRESEVIPLPRFEEARASLPGLRSDLDVWASVRTGPMAKVIGTSLGTQLARMSSVLLEAPLARTEASRLVITVPGVLSGVPWSMLPAMRGRTFTLASSATQWFNGRRTDSAGPASIGLAAGPRVARGEPEISVAAAAWSSPEVLRGSDATVDAVTTLAGSVDLLHIAAHGRHAADNALFSGLELVDGALFGYDIDRMPRIPSIVVLSACELGRSTVRWGNEAIGMTRAWLHAGARCVIATPVVVSDDDACELLGAVHAGLATGRNPSVALREAASQTGVIAPFQCHGDGL